MQSPNSHREKFVVALPEITSEEWNAFEADQIG
jgi:hypothetical protein